MPRPSSAMIMVTARIGPGQRTMAVPTLRQVRFLMVRLDSSSPNFVATSSTAGPMVSDAATTTSMPMAHGTPKDSKYGRRVNFRQNVAPAMVRPDPRITCETL
ncbi:Uncharacterised protein [Mycobacteroides abscessus subsp. abscessus]|nr:Uncharacterised protein [Mycobacteroides abscessus subsp. abscessus]